MNWENQPPHDTDSKMSQLAEPGSGFNLTAVSIHQILLENKDITKLPINLALLYFTTFRCISSSKSEWQFVKKRVKLPRVMYLLEIKCLGTILSLSVMEDKQFGRTMTWTARAQQAVHWWAGSVVAPGSGSGYAPSPNEWQHNWCCHNTVNTWYRIKSIR